MIPIKLKITGFLSYHQTTELDFSSFNLACISGQNGAGKSSLLDAFTWVLFGQARRHDDSLINSRSSLAEVELVFLYEGNTYKVRRSLPKGKTTSLEFQILEPESGKWKPLTQHTLRETQAYIERTLRLDYETFVNASFFLQGKADQFTQQKASDRKRILGSILGLEVWESYRDRANLRRKAIELEIVGLEARLGEINSELSEEEERKKRLAALQADLKHLAQASKAQEQLLDNARKVDATLGQQRKLVDMLGAQLEAASSRVDELEKRLASLQLEREEYAQRVAKAESIEAEYAAWQTLRLELERWDGVAARFREHEARRQAPLMEIRAAQAGLVKELENLKSEELFLINQQASREELETQLATATGELGQLEKDLQRRAELDELLQGARVKRAEAMAENPRLKTEMVELKERIDKLTETEDAECPLCGRPMDAGERNRLIDELTTQGTDLGNRYRANLAFLSEAEQMVSDFEAQINALDRLDRQRLQVTQDIARMSEQVRLIKQRAAEWDQSGLMRLKEVRVTLEGETYAGDARQLLSVIDEELKTIGYDAAAHDLCRSQESTARVAEGEFRALEAARAALQPLGREIANGHKQLESNQAELARLRADYDDAAAQLAAAQAQAPDLEAIEREMNDLLEQENALRMEVGAAQQKVLVLKDLKVRLRDLGGQREQLARKVGQLKILERAFGKDGVPSLLIEQALPEIETRANNLLDRLSGGNMSIRFATQAAFKDKKREDLKETLDILISDGAGTRDYELYSGGEAFRVNFAIRLALSELLAQRAGARLQTLVVDEGFGSQDAMGRQHLIEAINLVKDDFAKVLVITHIEELKEAFPNRIEVEKTVDGSTVRVV